MLQVITRKGIFYNNSCVVGFQDPDVEGHALGSAQGSPVGIYMGREAEKKGEYKYGKESFPEFNFHLPLLLKLMGIFLNRKNGFKKCVCVPPL
jgi:hypothetical protein